MNRRIIFRGKDLDTEEWVYGDLIQKPGHFPIIRTSEQTPDGEIEYDERYVMIDTVGQFTGLKDKNGVDVYEDDIIEYYHSKLYCINPDCEPPLHEYCQRIIKKISKVENKSCMFGVECENSEPLLLLPWCGINEELLECCKSMDEKECVDTNGYNLDDSIVGFKVIGTIYDNPSLLNKQNNEIERDTNW